MDKFELIADRWCSALIFKTIEVKKKQKKTKTLDFCCDTTLVEKETKAKRFGATVMAFQCVKFFLHNIKLICFGV